MRDHLSTSVTSEASTLVFDPATRGVFFIPVVDYMNTWNEFALHAFIAVGFFIVGANYGKHLGRIRAIASVLPALAAFERLQKRTAREHKELVLRRATMERMQGAGVDTTSFEAPDTPAIESPYAMDAQVRALLSKPTDKL